jgi:hypothetical protein
MPSESAAISNFFAVVISGAFCLGLLFCRLAVGRHRVDPV